MSSDSKVIQQSQFIRPITPSQVRSFLESVDSVMDLDKLKDTTPFSEAGADSLDLFNIILQVQQATGLEITDDDVAKVSTINDLAAYLNARME